MEWPFSTREVLKLLGFFSKSTSESIDIPCPYCDDKSKHLNFNLKKNQFRCNRCGAFGNTLQFYMDMAGLNNCKEAYWDIMQCLNLDEKKPVEIKTRRKRIEKENKSVQTVSILDEASRHKTYQTILKYLDLEERHMQNLIKRGLSEEEVKRLGYKSFPGSIDGIMKHLYAEGVPLIGVPGFYEYYGKIKFIREKKGILVPVRNMNGYIVGLQLRIDDEEREVEANGKLSNKYKWVSSGKLLKGCGTSSIHFTCSHTNKANENSNLIFDKDKTIYLTEGPMKADVAHFLTDYKLPFLAVAGVNNTSSLKEICETLKELGLKRIVLMYDMDYKTNENVQKGLKKTKEIIRQSGLEVISATWNEKYKGIDDYLKFRKQEKTAL